MSITLDLREAAAMMKVHPKTVLGLIDSGALPAAKIGRAYVLMVRDVQAHIEGNIARQTSERMRKITTSSQQGSRPAGSRSASSSGATCAR